MSPPVRDRAGPKTPMSSAKAFSPLRSLCSAAALSFRIAFRIADDRRDFRHLGSPWVPSYPAGGAHCDRRQLRSKSTASLGPRQRQPEPEYAVGPGEISKRQTRLYSRRRRAPVARQ
jgi:hypothetical protein